MLRVIVVTELWCKEHLANAFDCDLAQDTVLHHDIIAGQDVKELRHLILADPMNDQPIDNTLDCNYFFTPVLTVLIKLLIDEYLLKNLAVIEEDIFIKNAN